MELLEVRPCRCAFLVASAPYEKRRSLPAAQFQLDIASTVFQVATIGRLLRPRDVFLDATHIDFAFDQAHPGGWGQRFARIILDVLPAAAAVESFRPRGLKGEGRDRDDALE